MAPILILLGAVFIGSGTVFVAQGLGLSFAPGSFMTGDRAWVLIGAGLIVVGAVCIGGSRWRGPRAS